MSHAHEYYLKLAKTRERKRKGDLLFFLIGATKGQRKKRENLQGLSSI